MVSVLGALLINTFLGDLFLSVEDTDFASYVDSNTAYVIGDVIHQVASTLEDSAFQILLR